MESDGTYFKLRGFEEADSVEVRAMVAYASLVGAPANVRYAAGVDRGMVTAAQDFERGQQRQMQPGDANEANSS